MSQSVERIHDGHTEDKVAHERNRSRVTEEVHAALVIQGCWRAYKNYKNHHRPSQTESQQAGLNIARAHEAPAELSPADAFEAALAEALARQSRQESAGVGNSQESGQGRFTLTPPNTPALGTSPPTLETGAVREPRAGGSPPGTAMHAIPEEAEGTVVEDRAILPAPTVQPKKAETAAAAALSSPVPFDDQVTDLASAIVPEQYGKLFKEPTSPATMVGGQRPEAEQLGREWSVPVAGTLHVAKALENLDTQGEKTVPKAEAAQEDSEPKAPPCTGTPTPDRRSNNGYATDVEDEAAGGPKGDLQSHISRNIAAPTTEATGGTAEAQALASYERFPPPQGPMQEPRPEAERKEEAGELQLGGQPPQQQEQRSPGVTAASAEQQVAQPLTGRRIVLQEQAAAQAPTPRPAPRRQQVQEPAVLLEEETVLLGGPERSAARSIPVGGPLAPEIGPESRSAPTITSIPGQWGDNISGAFGDGLRGMQPSVGRTAATVASAAWGAPEQAPSSSKASKTRAGARASKLKDAAYGVLYALDDVAHAAALARGNLGVIIAEAGLAFEDFPATSAPVQSPSCWGWMNFLGPLALSSEASASSSCLRNKLPRHEEKSKDKIGDVPVSDTWQHAEAQPMEQNGASETPGKRDMLGAMQKLSDVLRTAYSQENNTAGQGLDEAAGELQEAGSSGLGLGSVDTPRMPERGLGIRAQEILTMEEEEVWAAAAVELTPKEAPEASPYSDSPMAAAAARIAGGLVKLLIFLGLALSMWTCLAFISDYDQHVEHALPPA